MGPSDWPIILWITNSWLDHFFFHMQFLWFHRKNSYTEETINLFAKFGFELLKLCAGGDKLNKLPRNSNVLNPFWTWKILSVIIILIQHVMPTRLMHYFSCWQDLYQSSDNRSTTSKQVVAPQCTSIKHRVHGSKGWGMCPLIHIPLQWFQGRTWKLRGKCFS